MKIYSVYLIQNTENNKVYVGCTSLSVMKRFKKHISNSNIGRNGKFYDAMREIGEDKFYHTLVSKHVTQAEAWEQEKNWIRILDTTTKGYNTAKGGAGGLNPNWVKGSKRTSSSKEKQSKTMTGRPSRKKKSVIFNDEIVFSSITEASEKTGVLIGTIGNNLTGRSKSTKVGVFKYL